MLITGIDTSSLENGNVYYKILFKSIENMETGQHYTDDDMINVIEFLSNPTPDNPYINKVGFRFHLNEQWTNSLGDIVIESHYLNADEIGRSFTEWYDDILDTIKDQRYRYAHNRQIRLEYFDSGNNDSVFTSSLIRMTI